jgi:hypothetical protein
MDKALNKVDQKKVQSWRIRTIIYSIIASGVIALFINNIDESNRYNSRVEENRNFCMAIYSDRAFLKEISDEVSRSSPDPRVRLRWSRYKEEFETRLPPFLDRCDDIYKKRSVVPFIE